MTLETCAVFDQWIQPTAITNIPIM